MVVEHLIFTVLGLTPSKQESETKASKKIPLDGSKELFVQNIVPMEGLKDTRQVDNKLQELFEQYGTVAKIKFVAATFNEATIKAYVNYAQDSPKGPQAAIDNLNGRELRGQKIQVEFHSVAKLQLRQ